MTEIYDPAYPTGDDEDDEFQRKDSDKTKTMNRTSKGRATSLRDPAGKTTSNDKKNQSASKADDSPKAKKVNDNVPPSRRKISDRLEVNGEDIKLSPKARSSSSARTDNKAATNTRKTKCQDKISLNTQCAADNSSGDNSSEHLTEDSVNCEGSDSSPLTKETKNICLHSSSDSISSKLDSNVKAMSKETAGVRSEENSSDNVIAQQACSSEAESSDSRCSGSSAASGNQNAHKRKFGKFRLLDSELLSSSTDQTPKQEYASTDKTQSCLDDRNDVTVDKNESTSNANEPCAENCAQKDASLVSSSELSNQVNEKEEHSCEETIVRRSSRIRLIVEKKEKEKEEKGKPEKTKKGKGEQKDNSMEKKKTDKPKEIPKEDRNETKSKEEPLNRTDPDTNQKEKSMPSQDKKEKNIRTKGNNMLKGRASIKIDDQKNENCDENKQRKLESHIPSPVPIQSCSPKHDGRKDLDDIPKPEKVKSRWRRSSELERGEVSGGSTPTYMLEANEQISPIPSASNNTSEIQSVPEKVKSAENGIPPYEKIEENIYLFERKRSKCKKEVRRMLCDCSLTKEEKEKNVPGCGEDCLNRLLMIECGYRCATGDACTNKRFQKKEYVKTEPFKTAKKGWGLRSLEPVPQGTFVMEYVGEVLSPQEFKRRVKDYAREKSQHYYFMALKSDEIIDATCKGNLSRFINHSCDPNCETQKWTVNGELRIGFFTRRAIASGEELTFDYQFQRYGKEAQKCFCESYNCRGCIGDDKQLALKPSQNRNTVPKRRKPADDRKREIVEDLALEDEIERLSAVGGLRNREQTLMLARLMVRAEDNDTRRRLLDIIENTTEQACLRLFLDYHGLSLLWSWMVDMGDDAKSLKTQILRVLTRLPIPNKTMLLDSKILNLVERWSKQITCQKSDRENEGTEAEQMSDLSSAGVSQQEMSEPSNKKLRLLEDMTSDSESPIISPHNSNSENAYLPDDSKMDSDSSSNYKNSLSFEQTNEVRMKSKDKHSDVQSDKKSDYPFKKQPLLPNPSCARVNLETGGVKDESANNSGSDEMTRYAGDSKSGEMLVRVDEESRDTPDYEDRAEVATMASKLLETWNGLKEVFRIPRLEKQKRREDEQEADRHEKEYSRNFRNQDQRWSQPKDKHNFGREKQYKEKGREFENRSRDFENRSRDYDNRSREYDNRPRDFENRSGDFEGRPREYDNRTMDMENKTGEFGHDSMDFPAESNEEQKYLLESPDWRDDKWYSKPNRRANAEQEEVICRPRKSPLLPTPPRLSKAERRHLFALEVQQREEEALRHQQEQEQPMAEYQPNESYAYQSDSTYPQYFEVEQSYVQQIPTAPDTQMQVSGVPVSSPQGLIMPDTTSESPAAPVARMPLLPTPTYIDSPRPQAPIPTPIPTPHPTSLPGPPPVPLPAPLPGLPGSHPPPSHPGPHPPPPHAMPVPHPVSHPPPHPGALPPPGPLSAPPPALHTAPPPALHSAPPPTLHPAPLIHAAPPPPVPHHMSHPPPHPGTHPLPHPAPHVLPHPAPHPTPQLAPHSVAPPGPVQTSASHPQSYPEQPPPAVGYPPSGVIYPQAPPAQDISHLPFASAPAPAPAPMQTPAPVTVQGAPYHAEESQYINRQQIYYTHPPAAAPLSDHSVAVHQPLEHHTASSLRMEPTSTMVEDRHPSPPPLKADKPAKLPPSWKTAKDAEGNIYYYHAITRQTQWDPPTADQVDEDMDLGTPTYDEPKQSKKKGTTTAAADTSSEVAKKIRELFRTKMSSFIVQCLNPYRKPDCKVGRISSTEDFKHLARKLTHFVMAKELKHCRNVEDLECNESVKHKAKDFINKYMAKFGSSYRKDKLSSPKDD